MTSGETLDPRIVEKTLDESITIHRSCIVGDNFLREASTAVCAILELSPSDARGYHASLADVTRVLAAANRALPPPLRISWSRVLVLSQDQHIPLTRKGDIFRKKLEDVFGSQLRTLLLHSEGTPLSSPQASNDNISGPTEDSVVDQLTTLVATELRLERSVLDDNRSSTFAEVRASFSFCNND